MIVETDAPGLQVYDAARLDTTLSISGNPYGVCRHCDGTTVGRRSQSAKLSVYHFTSGERFSQTSFFRSSQITGKIERSITSLNFRKAKVRHFCNTNREFSRGANCCHRGLHISLPVFSVYGQPLISASMNSLICSDALCCNTKPQTARYRLRPHQTEKF